MGCNRKSTAQPLPCQQLAAAQQQMMLYRTGQAIISVETPGLGRVEYSAINIGDLQREIDRLSAQCAAAGGTVTGSGGMRRRPLSFEANP